MGSAGGFAGHPIGAFADGEDGYVGFLGDGYGVGDGFGFVGDDGCAGSGLGTVDEAGVAEGFGIVAGEYVDAAGVEEMVAEPLRERGAEADGVAGVADAGPGAEHVFGGVGEGADEGDGLGPFAEGEQGAAALGAGVFEQDDGFVGDFSGLGALVGGGYVFGADGGVGMVKEAEGELDAENAAGGFIDNAFRDDAGTDLGGEGGAVEVALHIHVNAGGEGLAGGG